MPIPEPRSSETTANERVSPLNGTLFHSPSIEFIRGWRIALTLHMTQGGSPSAIEAAPDPKVLASHPYERAPGPPVKKLGIILAIVVAGFIASSIFHYQLGIVEGQPYPLNTFLFRPFDQLSDVDNIYVSAKEMFGKNEQGERPPIGIGSIPLLLYSWLLYLLFFPHSTFVVWLATTALFVGAALYLVRKTVLAVGPDCVWAKTLALTFCSYPVLICLDRGNFENIIFVLLAAAVYLYRQRRFTWSAVAIGIAVAAKPYSIVFLPLFASDRRFKEMFLAIFVALLVTFGSFCLLPGKMSTLLDAYRISLTDYSQSYVIGNEGLYFGSSLFGLAKVCIYWNQWFLEGADRTQVVAFLRGFASIYFKFSALFFAAIASVICLFRMEFWKKIALILCCMNLLPYICGDYRLMHLFIPMLLFIEKDESSWGDDLFALTFGLLLIPTSYIHLVFNPVFQVIPGEVSDSVVLHPLLMLMLVIGIIFSIFRSPESSETAHWLWQGIRRLDTTTRS